MSSLLNVTLHELTTEKKGILRYFELILRTVRLVASQRSTRVYVQNPSIVLSMLVLFIKPLFRFKLIVDEHNAGIYPLEGKFILFNFLARTIVRFSDIVIVTNDALAQVCRRWGGTPIVMPDPLPSLEFLGKNCSESDLVVGSGSPFVFLFICTWAEDEPYEKLIESAAQLNKDDIEVRVTGKVPDRYRNKDGISPNVKLLGFISEEDYLKELFSCHAVLVMTNRENCLNCGAYEAVSAGRPGILSDTRILRSYFHKGFVFTNNSSEDITRKIIDVRNRSELLKRQVESLKQELLVKDRAAAENLAAAISHLS